MKNPVILLILVFVSKIVLFAQTSEPTQIGLTLPHYTPSIPNNSYYIGQHQNDFELNTPIFGWMWNSKPAISAMVLANQEHIYSSDNFNKLYNSTM